MHGDSDGDGDVDGDVDGFVVVVVEAEDLAVHVMWESLDVVTAGLTSHSQDARHCGARTELGQS